jgi:uncharacterized cupin superfamily protein
MSAHERPNVFAAAAEFDGSDPDGYRCGVIRAGEAAGGKDLSVKVYEIPSGQSLCPYHYEYEEEWLIVLDGAVELRAPDGERALARGEVVCFPPGPAGAHKVGNAGHQTARIVMFSRAREPAVAVYPDSGKVGVWTSEDTDQFMFRRADADVGYYDGEV